MKIKPLLIAIPVLLFLSSTGFSQIIFDSTYTGFIKNRAGIEGNIEKNISKAQLDSSSRIIFSDPILNDQLQIVHFELTIVTPGQKPIEFVNNSDGLLTKSMKDALNSVSSGNKIYLEHIKVKSNNNRQYSLFATDYIVK